METFTRSVRSFTCGILLAGTFLLAGASMRATAQPTPGPDQNDPEAMGAMSRVFPGPADVYLIGADTKQPTFTGVRLVRAMSLPGGIFYQGILDDKTVVLFNPSQIAAVKVSKK
ncbi:MAG TPA: hypothetical protein VHQ47_07580 [Phycisphaerae bacterium]|nr:hypothetical protein [Phycisphaerae bacterium]